MTGVRMQALSRYAVEIQAALSALTPRLAWIRGRAGMTSACIIAKTVPASASTASSAVVRTGTALAGARVTGRVGSAAEEFTRASEHGSGCFTDHPQGSSHGRVNTRSGARIATPRSLTLPPLES